MQIHAANGSLNMRRAKDRNLLTFRPKRVEGISH